MAASILHVGATVMCAHAGSATPVSSNPRVSVSGQPVVTIDATYTISGCTLPTPPNGNGPCVTGMWTVGATRVTAGGKPVLLQSGSATCTPTGTPLQVANAQMRVTAT